MTASQPMALPVKVPFGEKLAYGVGDLAFNLVWAAVGTYLTFFYTEVAGIPATTVGMIFLVARLFDGASDLVVGILVEKVSSRFGKARPWLLYLAIPYGVCAVLLFTAPAFGPAGKVIYAFVTYTLSVVVVYTAMNIPYGVLNALMTSDQVERGMLNTFRMFFGYVGAIIVSALTLPLVNAMGGEAWSWTLVAGLYAILAVSLFFMVFKFCKERVNTNTGSITKVSAEDDPELARSNVQHVKIGKALGSLVRNKYWLILIAFGILLFIGYTLTSIYPYYAKYALGDENISAMLFTFRRFLELAGVLIAVPITRRLGKRNATLYGCIAIVAGQLVVAIAPESLTVILIGVGIAGIGAGIMFGVIFAMIADTIEYEQWRSGVRAEGLVFAGATVGQKVGGAFGSMIVGLLLGLGGYIEGSSAEQPDAAMAQIHFMFVWLPAIIGAAMFVLMLFYRLDKEYPRILADLQARAEAEAELEDEE